MEETELLRELNVLYMKDNWCQSALYKRKAIFLWLLSKKAAFENVGGLKEEDARGFLLSMQ